MSREYFNKMAAGWDERVNHNQKKIKNVIKGLPGFQNSRQNPRILDVGSGTGILLPLLVERYGEQAEITALDYAEEMIEVSREKHSEFGNINYIAGDIYTHPLPEGYYNLIICYSVFPHFQDKQAVLIRLKRLLAVEGYLIIYHSQSRKKINNMHGNIDEVNEDHLPPADKLGEMAGKLGFEVVDIIDNKQEYLLKLMIT